MVEVIPASNTFSTLSTRSPTPSRDRRRKQGHSSLATPVPNFGNGGLWPDSSLHTPPSNPTILPLNSIGPASSIERPRKRVKFNGPDISLDAGQEHISIPSWSSQPRQLPPSRELTSTKSILKPCDRPIPLAPSPRRPVDQEVSSRNEGRDTVNMLESAVQELSRMSRSSKLDAYMTLAGALKGYDGTPKPESIASKINLLLPSILRDLSAVLPGTEYVDTALILQALKLTSIFVWQPTISANLTPTFCIAVVERAIEALGMESQTPKVLTIQYMRLLGRQRFSRKILTQERTVRLIQALDVVTGHIKGNGIVGERLVVYQRLLQQVHPVMVNNVEYWSVNVILAMLSSLKEIRSRAIALGMEAGLSIGHIPRAAGLILSMFDRNAGEVGFATSFADRLEEMRINRDECQHVPQIWSVIVLYFRSSQQQFQKWRHFDLWRQILQKCFNSNDTGVKFQANLAWDKLVFVINPSENTEREMIKMLLSPISGQLERRSSDKSTKDAKIFALSSLCNLLYYSLRPGSSFQQLDLYWNSYVGPLFKDILLKSKVDSKYGCGILYMLFDSSRVRTWDMNRANEFHGLFKPEELPKLDERWTRSRSHLVIDVLSAGLRTTSWSLSATNPGHFEKLWIKFLGSIKEASSKEIKITQELVDCVMTLLGFFSRIWETGKSALAGEQEICDDEFIERFGFLVANSVSILGALCFTEKLILYQPCGSFEAITSQANQLHGQLYPAIVSIFQLFVNPPKGVIPTSSYYDSLRDLLKMCCERRGSRRAQIELLQDCIQMLPSGSEDSADLDHSQSLWQILADIATDMSKTHFHDVERQEDSTLGLDCLRFVRILQWPCQQVRMDRLESWKRLLDALSNSVEQFSSVNEVALGVVEPIAKVLLSSELQLDTLWHLSSDLLGAAEYTDNRQSIEAAHKHLWGSQTKCLSPSQALCQLPLLVNKVLLMSYERNESKVYRGIEAMICALTDLWSRRLRAVFDAFIGSLQESVSILIKDIDQCLVSGFEEAQIPVDLLYRFWDQLLRCIQESIPYDDELLQRFEPLITSGFASCHRDIVTSTMAFWNQTFGLSESISCPPSLLQAILLVKRDVNLKLPHYSEGSGDKLQLDSQEWTHAQDDGQSGISTAAILPKRRGQRTRKSITGTRNDRLLRSQKSIELPGGVRRLRRTSQRISKSMGSPKGYR